jgi:CheY-like chemotaxis protein
LNIESSSTTSIDSLNPHLRLLVVDDAIACRKMVVRVIKKQGYAYAEAKNGQEAVDAVRLSMEQALE